MCKPTTGDRCILQSISNNFFDFPQVPFGGSSIRWKNGVNYSGKWEGEVKMHSKESCYIWELLALTLKEMVAEGVIEEEKLHSFNIPQYTPSPTEVKREVDKEGNFSINHLETSEISWATWGKGFHLGTEPDGHNMSSCMRSVAEPLLSERFGECIMDQIFDKYSKIICDRLAKGDEPKVVKVVTVHCW